MTEEVGIRRIWSGIGLGIIPAIIFVFGYLNIHPELFRSFPADFGANYDASFTGIDWDDDEKNDPPIKYVSDQYEGTLISTEIVEVTSFWSLWNRPKSRFEYRWEYKVKNLSDDKRTISVTYRLVDKFDEDLVTSFADGIANPNETITITGRASIDWDQIEFIKDRSWSIGNRVTN